MAERGRERRMGVNCRRRQEAGKGSRAGCLRAPQRLLGPISGSGHCCSGGAHSSPASLSHSQADGVLLLVLILYPCVPFSLPLFRFCCPSFLLSGTKINFLKPPCTVELGYKTLAFRRKSSNTTAAPGWDELLGIRRIHVAMAF